MNKIYGFKESRIKEFGEYLKRTDNTKNLTKVFSEYSAASGMSKGTVRNMYYALARECQKDDDLKKTYWGEKEIKVNKSEFFSSEKERELVKKVLFGKMNGKSIRKSVYELADGNELLNTWFAGVYPYNNPKYAIVIMMEQGTSGAKDCCPIFRTIVESLA